MHLGSRHKGCEERFLPTCYTGCSRLSGGVNANSPLGAHAVHKTWWRCPRQVKRGRDVCTSQNLHQKACENGIRHVTLIHVNIDSNKARTETATDFTSSQTKKSLVARFDDLTEHKSQQPLSSARLSSQKLADTHKDKFRVSPDRHISAPARQHASVWTIADMQHSLGVTRHGAGTARDGSNAEHRERLVRHTQHHLG